LGSSPFERFETVHGCQSCARKAQTKTTGYRMNFNTESEEVLELGYFIRLATSINTFMI